MSADRAAFPAPFSGEPSLAGRAMLVRRADVVPLECVARGYLSGSGWSQYRETGASAASSSRRAWWNPNGSPTPIFTPTTKAAEGHDLPLTPDEAIDLVGRGLAERLKELTLALYERIAATAAERGIILADTKFEFGFAGGELMLVDEVGTPDSCRFWPADELRAGGARSRRSTSSSCATGWMRAGGTTSLRPRRCRTTSWPAPRHATARRTSD